VSNILSKEDKLARIAKIDEMFEDAKSWGSWMVFAANERASLVDRLAKYDGVTVEHKYRTNAS
jgi:hypothetical protein